MRSRGNRDGGVPDPWSFLAAELADVVLIRERIKEPGRYYDDRRAIVLRKGLSIEAERRYLWHEIVHAIRRDEACHGWARHTMERSVEREAARRAMPLLAMEAQMAGSATWPDFVWAMKVPEVWVRFRLEIAHPAERIIVDRACRWSSAESTA